MCKRICASTIPKATCRSRARWVMRGVIKPNFSCIVNMQNGMNKLFLYRFCRFIYTYTHIVYILRGSLSSYQAKYT